MGSTLLRRVSGAGKPAALGLVLLAALLAVPAASAAPGDLDPSFGSGGKVVTDFGGTYGGASAVAVQADGKIVVAGSVGSLYEDRSIAVARYNSDGSLDDSFAGDGMQITDVGGGFDSGGHGLAVQADGGIVVVGLGGGVGSEQAVVVRYTADGSLDPGFSGDGMVALDFYSASAAAIQPDGRVIVGGGDPFGVGGSYRIARLTSSGDPDPTFSEDGVQTISITGAWESVAALELDNAGRIIAGGRTDTDWGLLRLSSDGELDPTFSGDGKQVTDYGGTYLDGSDNLTDLAVQPDGAIVAVGWKTGATLLARYSADGTLDPGFTRTITGDEHPSNAVALQTSGKVVTAGASMDGLVVARHHADGTPDTGFQGDGLGAIDVEYGASDITIQPDGSILVAGSPAEAKFGLVRLDGTNAPPIITPPSDPTPPAPPATTPPAPKPTKPAAARLTNVRLSDKTITTRQRATISFRLSTSARVTVRVLKTKAGVRKGKRCVKPGKSRGGQRCDLQVASLSRSLGAGAHRVKLPKLNAGRYRVAIQSGRAVLPPQQTKDVRVLSS